jgi:malonate transporter and related proteins
VQALLQVILPVFLVIGAGYLAVRLRAFPEAGADALMKFTQNFAIPCLLFAAIARLDLGATLQPALLFSFYAGATAGFLAGLLGARFLFGGRGRIRSPSASPASFPTACSSACR